MTTNADRHTETGTGTGTPDADASVRVYSEAGQLAVAQQVLDTHVTSSQTGRCRECGAKGPCFRRETAMAVWSLKRWLPRRVPGLSQPERIGARRVDLVRAARRVDLAKAALRVDRMRLGGVPDERR